MKVSNDLIDMVTEACLSISGQTKRGYDECLAEFLTDYLGVPGTLEMMDKAIRNKPHEE